MNQSPLSVCLQVVEDGYEFFAKRQLVTLFSAPNYCGEFDNAGAMMSVDETLMCSFQVSTFVVMCCRAILPDAPSLTAEAIAIVISFQLRPYRGILLVHKLYQ